MPERGSAPAASSRRADDERERAEADTTWKPHDVVVTTQPIVWNGTYYAAAQ